MGKYGRVPHSGKYGKYTIPLAVCESGKIYSNMIINIFNKQNVSIKTTVVRQ